MLHPAARGITTRRAREFAGTLPGDVWTMKVRVRYSSHGSSASILTVTANRLQSTRPGRLCVRRPHLFCMPIPCRYRAADGLRSLSGTCSATSEPSRRTGAFRWRAAARLHMTPDAAAETGHQAGWRTTSASSMLQNRSPVSGVTLYTVAGNPRAATASARTLLEQVTDSAPSGPVRWPAAGTATFTDRDPRPTVPRSPAPASRRLSASHRHHGGCAIHSAKPTSSDRLLACGAVLVDAKLQIRVLYFTVKTY